MISQVSEALGRKGRADNIGEVRMTLQGHKENSNRNSTFIPDLIPEVTTNERSVP